MSQNFESKWSRTQTMMSVQKILAIMNNIDSTNVVSLTDTEICNCQCDGSNVKPRQKPEVLQNWYHTTTPTAAGGTFPSLTMQLGCCTSRIILLPSLRPVLSRASHMGVCSEHELQQIKVFF